MNLNQCATLHLQELAGQNLLRQLPVHAGQSGRIDLSSNDYLGLSQNPQVIQAGVEYAEKYGAGATGSRLLSGNLPCFEELEKKLPNSSKHKQRFF